MIRRRTVLASSLFPIGLALAHASASCASAGAGSSQTGPPVVSPPVSYLSISDGARLCAGALGCAQLPASITASTGVPIDATSFSRCMTWVSGPVPAGSAGFALQQQALACVAAATTCDAAGACLALERLAPSDPRCPDGGALQLCEPGMNTVLRCGPSPVAIHCSLPYFEKGTTCAEGADHSFWCAIGRNCALPPTCTGSVLEYCGGNTKLLFGVDCSAVGGACGVDPTTGSTDCLTDGTLRPCHAVDSPTCAGDDVEVCNDETLSIFKCGDMGATCEGAQGRGRCAQPDDTCSPDAPDPCAGTVLSLCVGGKPVPFDCATIGRTCKTVSGTGRCG